MCVCVCVYVCSRFHVTCLCFSRRDQICFLFFFTFYQLRLHHVLCASIICVCLACACACACRHYIVVVFVWLPGVYAAILLVHRIVVEEVLSSAVKSVLHEPALFNMRRLLFFCWRCEYLC